MIIEIVLFMLLLLLITKHLINLTKVYCTLKYGILL